MKAFAGIVFRGNCPPYSLLGIVFVLLFNIVDLGVGLTKTHRRNFLNYFTNNVY